METVKSVTGSSGMFSEITFTREADSLWLPPYSRTGNAGWDAFENAPLDDEPETDEERAAITEARADITAGRVRPHKKNRRQKD